MRPQVSRVYALKPCELCQFAVGREKANRVGRVAIEYAVKVIKNGIDVLLKNANSLWRAKCGVADKVLDTAFHNSNDARYGCVAHQI